MLSHAEALAAAACRLRRAPVPAEKAVTRGLVVKGVNAMQHVAYTEVYAPMFLDPHGEFMTAEGVEQIAHRFVQKAILDTSDGRIDILHNRKPGAGVPVESWVNHGDPRFAEGAWVMGVKVFSEKAWQDILDGKMETLSFRAMVDKREVSVEVEGDRILRIVPAEELKEAA